MMICHIIRVCFARDKDMPCVWTSCVLGSAKSGVSNFSIGFSVNFHSTVRRRKMVSVVRVIKTSFAWSSFVLGSMFNIMLIWLINRHTPQVMRVYSKVGSTLFCVTKLGFHLSAKKIRIAVFRINSIDKTCNVSREIYCSIWVDQECNLPIILCKKFKKNFKKYNPSIFKYYQKHVQNISRSCFRHASQIWSFWPSPF